MKRVRITNDNINSYGTRILTSGMDTVQYEKNPVLLYMHERGKVIGYMKDIRREGSEITGEPVFDEATELSVQCKKQWECGSLRMVSVGIDILEMSDAAEDVAPGQIAPTVTKCKLSEVSVVDIGSNDDAIQLKKDGLIMTLGKGSANPLPTLSEYNSNNIQKPNEQDMEMKKIALAMGMPETSDEASVLAAVQALTAAKEKLATMEKQLADMECRTIIDAVEEAIEERRLDPSKKDQFVELGKKVGSETLKEILKAMHPQTKLSSILPGSDNPGHQIYAKLSEVPAKEMMELRSKQPEEYARLYKAEYGMEINP